jgi:predicted AAA+ superfamily ATPase
MRGVDLHTLSRAELVEAGRSLEETAYIFLGGYPELHVGDDASLWFPSYVATYLERDVRNILRVIDLQDFNRFLRVCALRTSQVLNYSDLARDTGIAPNTARKWMSLLQTSAVVSLIEPYYGNRTKRLIKSPKLVFLDTGLAAFLAGFRSAGDLFSSSHAGAFWETYVFGQIIRQTASSGLPSGSATGVLPAVRKWIWSWSDPAVRSWPLSVNSKSTPILRIQPAFVHWLQQRRVVSKKNYFMSTEFPTNFLMGLGS